MYIRGVEPESRQPIRLDLFPGWFNLGMLKQVEHHPVVAPLGLSICVFHAFRDMITSIFPVVGAARALRAANEATCENALACEGPDSDHVSFLHGSCNLSLERKPLDTLGMPIQTRSDGSFPHVSSNPVLS
jgi:hypothetical protein